MWTRGREYWVETNVLYYIWESWTTRKEASIWMYWVNVYLEMVKYKVCRINRKMISRCANYYCVDDFIYYRIVEYIEFISSPGKFQITVYFKTLKLYEIFDLFGEGSNCSPSWVSGCACLFLALTQTPTLARAKHTQFSLRMATNRYCAKKGSGTRWGVIL